VIPWEHIFSLVGFQKVMAPKVSQHPFSHGVPEALQQLVVEGFGFVEAKVGCGTRRVLIRLLLDLLEQVIDQVRNEATQKA